MASFLARLENLNGMRSRGEKGQFVSVFPTHHLVRMDAFLAPHRRVMVGLSDYLKL